MTVIQKIATLIRPYMKENGYKFSKKCYYKIQNDIAFCIQFDMPGGLIYATFFVMPLFIPCQNRYYTYGNRINSLHHSQLSPLSKLASDDEIGKWCGSLCDQLEKIVFPFFGEISTPIQLLNAVEQKRYLAGPFFSCPAIYISRLKLFGYLHTEEFEKLSLTIKKYPQVLRGSTFLTKTACNLYLEELELVHHLMKEGVQESRSFCSNTIKNALHNLF